MEQTIEFKIPEGYVFDKDNSTENVIRFKPIKKTVTYADITKELYSGNCYYINNNSTSWRHLQHLLALNKLMNVAKYLNGDWEPQFLDRSQKKWCIYYNFEDFKWGVTNYTHCQHAAVYFKSEELALQAIEILGEEAVKKALGIFK